MSDYVELKILRATPKMPARWNDPDSYDVQLQLSRPLGLSASCWQVGCLGCLFPGGLSRCGVTLVLLTLSLSGFARLERM